METTIKDVAKLADVSISTVSNVLNNTNKNVSPEIRNRVLKVAAQLNYQVNPIARSLRKGKSKTIGFAIADLVNYDLLKVVRGLDNYIARYGYTMLLADSKENHEIEIENIQKMFASSVDGIVLAPTTGDCSYLQVINKHREIPIAFVDRIPRGYECDSVFSKNKEGVLQAVEYLFKLGHRHIAFIGSRNIETMMERLEGYVDAHKKADIPINNNYIGIENDDSHIVNNGPDSVSYKLAQRIINNNPEITAIVSGSSMTSVGVYSFLKDNKILIPNEISFLTFDDSNWLRMVSPEITAIKQNLYEMGTIAGELLLKRIKSAKVSSPDYEQIRIPTNLTIRSSCSYIPN